MARSARDQLGWSEQRLAAVQEAINNTLARTAKCRGVVPKGPKKNRGEGSYCFNYRTGTATRIRGRHDGYSG
jgi:hypothetical protein